jgi:hypothetical protein
MPYLNETSSFDSIATPTARRAFTGGSPESKELLPAGTKLYKWTQHALAGPRGITPWWSLVNSLQLQTGTVAPALRDTQTWAERIGKNDRDYARVRSAVTQQWNRMDKPLFAELVQPVWAWVGKASGQLEDENEPKVYLIGGNYQVWAPNLTIQHIKQIAALPYLRPRA